MDNLFYTYDVSNTTLNNAKEQSNAHPDSLIFHSPTYSIFAKGKEFGTYVLDTKHHYQPVWNDNTSTYFGSTPSDTSDVSVYIPGDGSAPLDILTQVRTVRKISIDSTGHVINGESVILKHGSAGIGTADTMNNQSNINLAGDGTTSTINYYKGVSKDENGHVTGKNTGSFTIAHGNPGTGTADVITVSDVTIPADGTNGTLTYYAGISKDSKGHVTGKNSSTVNIKHGDILSAAINNKGQAVAHTLSYGLSFKVPYLSVSKQGHVTSLTDVNVTSYCPDCQDGSVKHFKTVSALPTSPDNTTIYFII